MTNFQPEKMNTPLLHRKPLFWEINEAEIPNVLRDNAAWVAQRVFEHGEVEDILNVVDLYGEEQVRELLRDARMDRMGQTMAWLFVELPKPEPEKDGA